MGADIEKVRNVNLRIAKRFFSKSECAALDAQEDSLKKRDLFRIWTLKESFVKAVGTGMHTALNSFSCRTGAAGYWAGSCFSGDKRQKVFLSRVSFGGVYKMAVCSETDDLCSHFLNIEL